MRDKCLLNWYAVRTKAQSEYLAAQVLGGQGFEVFLPLVGSPKPRAGREDTPLFPGYLFLRYDVEHQDWPSLTVLPGILGWVRFNGVVPAVPDEIVGAYCGACPGHQLYRRTVDSIPARTAGPGGFRQDGGPRRSRRRAAIARRPREGASRVHGKAGSGAGTVAEPAAHRADGIGPAFRSQPTANERPRPPDQRSRS